MGASDVGCSSIDDDDQDDDDDQVDDEDKDNSDNSGDSLPVAYSLHQNYPNPFNPATVLSFDIPDESYVRLEVFNMLGQQVTRLVDGNRPPGTYEILWGGTDDSGRRLASGVYLYRLTAGEYKSVKRMVLLK